MQDTTKTKNPNQGQVRFFTWEYDVPPKSSETIDQQSSVKTEQQEHFTITEEAVSMPDQSTAEPVQVHSSNNTSIKMAVIEAVEADTTDNQQAKQIVIGDIESNFQQPQEPVINISSKRYSNANSFGRLAVIFNDRKMMYYLFSALFLVSSTVVATLVFKLTEIGSENTLNFITKYDSYSRTLPKSFFGAFLLSAPILISSLIVFFGGFTIFSKFLSSLWVITVGAFWSIFSIYVFNSFGIFQKIIFTVLSAAFALICIIFCAEAGKYSHLNYYGKNELLKFSNVKNFSVIYLFFCLTTCLILYLYLKFAVI